MLQALRDKTTGWIAGIILTIVTVPFAFFGMESYMQQSVETYVARIAQPPTWWPSAPNVWPITYLWTSADIEADAFRQRVDLVRENMRQRQGDNFDPKQFESKDNKRRILDGLIDDQVLQFAAEQDDLAISDEEVRKAIQAMPDFQVDGVFNADRYQLILASQNPPLTPTAFQDKIREGLKNDLIPAGIADSAFVTAAEIDRLARLLSETRDVNWVMLPLPPADTAPVTDAQITAWYDAHRSEFRKPESVRLEYVVVDGSILPKPASDDAALRQLYQQQIAKYSTPEQREVSHILVQVAANASESEKKAAEAKARRLAAEARAPGADFAALARANSDDAGSKNKGGDLGWIRKEDMVPAFGTAAFALPAGQISAPVKSEFGWHIIKVSEVRPAVQRPFEEVRADLERELAQGSQEREFNDLIGKLVDEVLKSPTSLEPAAKAMGLTVQTTPAFTRAGGPGIAGDQKVLRAAFSDTLIQDGTASDPIEIGPDKTVLIRVFDHEPERALPLAQVRDAVIAAIRADRQRKAAAAAADALLKEAESKGLADAANAAKLAMGGLDGMQRGMPIPSQQAADVLFNQPRPENDRPRLGKALVGGAYMVYAIRAVHDGNLAQVTAQDRNTLREQMTMANGERAREAFIRALRARYQIKVAEDRL
ncbi:peptidyl-prolyl cis-trans isomerase [Thermomonas sp.]|uniref:peptidyl-prolyl cis-trans isomerase n=1 Tax=Thermomonas sp. TaxID=1971895 RepID=UPI001D8B0796|nr:peptidyl-prolyl cis-trans isomerase [Thermomonas sp.]MBZ0087241.1 peptidyl-prolyl cis-trans isomerase [Thermomonas sp.]HRO63801.1 peptidyl-prolyl cis-trans isomerase [Thermomonas sp.]